MHTDDPIDLLELSPLVSQDFRQLGVNTVGSLRSLRPEALLQLPDLDWEKVRLIATAIQAVNIRLEDNELRRERNELVREMIHLWLKRGVSKHLHAFGTVQLLEPPSLISSALRWVGVRTIGELQSLRPERLLQTSGIDWEKILLVARCMEKVGVLLAKDSEANSSAAVTTDIMPRVRGNATLGHSRQDAEEVLRVKGIQGARAGWRKRDPAFPVLEATRRLPDTEDATKLPKASLPVSDSRSASAKPNLLAAERNQLKTESSHLEGDDLQLLLEEERKSAQRLGERQSESTELANEAHDVLLRKVGKELDPHRRSLKKLAKSGR